MRLVKRLGRSSAVRRFASYAGYLYMRFVDRTTRWELVGLDHVRRFVCGGRPCIAAFWHGRMLMLPMGLQRVRATCARCNPVHMLISAHGDGRAISDAIRYTDILTVAGSTQNGGAEALRVLVRYLRAGEIVGITPDGPNGPAMRAAAGVIQLARLGQAPLLPYTYATSRRRILGTWDRFLVPLPFGRGVYVWGEPIEVPSDLDSAGMERWREMVETRLIALTAEADRRVGCAIVDPGTLTRKQWREQRRAARAGGA
jgi:lysophospholipid acyltransferase (LPLAT)-like uncharacterized protein